MILECSSGCGIILGALKLVLRTCQNNSSSIRYGGKDISFIRKNRHIQRGGEHMQVKGLFLNYKKNRQLMQYFFRIRGWYNERSLRCTECRTVYVSRALQINSSPQGWMARNTKPIPLLEKKIR